MKSNPTATSNEKGGSKPAVPRIEAGDDNDVRSSAMNATRDRSVHRRHSWLYDDLLA